MDSLKHQKNSKNSRHRVEKATQCGKDCLKKTPEKPALPVESKTSNFPAKHLIKY